MSKVVIIGGVAGGASCAARLRRLDEKAQIIILERGPYISYANCALPYHVGGVIKNRQALLLMTPQLMKARFNIDVRVKNEVIKIDRDKKAVTVIDRESGTQYEESYDTLVIATGSSPARPPIKGIDSPRVRTLWTVPDADALRAMRDEGANSAVVIGGGFIGLETAENLRAAGMDVTLVEQLNQVMPPIDYELAALLHEQIEKAGVDLILGRGVAEFEDIGSCLAISLSDGETLTCDFAVLAIGVRPNGALAKDAGLCVNARGGIAVDSHMRTSDPSIYAVGDVAEITDLVDGQKTMIPLAGPANKQGRIAADNICGMSETYAGTQGASVAKVFSLTVASVGKSEKALTARGQKKGVDFETVTISQGSHAGYYPGAEPMMIKLIFTKDGAILGAQIVGGQGVDKRIDTISVAQRLGGTVRDLAQLELSYAPPYSSAKDPVNMAGFVACNLLDGLVSFCGWDSYEREPQSVMLDVREDAEVAAFCVPGSVHIPLGQLRDRLGELDRDSDIIVMCAAGVRAHTASRMLRLNGFDHVRVYPGGIRFYRATHYKGVPERITPPGYNCAGLKE